MDTDVDDQITQEWRRHQAQQLRESVLNAMRKARARRLNDSLRSFALAGRDLTNGAIQIARG